MEVSRATKLLLYSGTDLNQLLSIISCTRGILQIMSQRKTNLYKMIKKKKTYTEKKLGSLTL